MTASASSPSVLKLKVTLKGMRPPVWRRLLVPDTLTLADLHEAIQAAMGWQSSHLHQFTIAEASYGDPSMLDEIADQRRYRLSRLVKEGVGRFTYVYDLGDFWEHAIVVEGCEPAVADMFYPACIAGKRACPPEDCGGVWGYQETLEILATPGHPERAERLEWLGGGLDPEAFSIEAANMALRARFAASGKRPPRRG